MVINRSLCWGYLGWGRGYIEVGMAPKNVGVEIIRVGKGHCTEITWKSLNFVGLLILMLFFMVEK